MPALPNVNALRVSMYWTTEAGNTVGSRFFVSWSGSTPTTSDCAAIATEVVGAYGTSLKQCFASTTVLNRVVVEDLSSDVGATSTLVTTVNGTHDGAYIPDSVAATLLFTIARHYRGGRPKIFLPAGSTTALEGAGSWLATFVALVNSTWSTFMAAVLATSGLGTTLQEHVNISYYKGFATSLNPITGRYRNIPKPRAVPVVDTVTAHACDRTIGSQRRRRTSIT